MNRKSHSRGEDREGGVKRDGGARVYTSAEDEQDREGRRRKSWGRGQKEGTEDGARKQGGGGGREG